VAPAISRLNHSENKIRATVDTSTDPRARRLRVAKARAVLKRQRRATSFRDLFYLAGLSA
jgi:hypothetical protein